MNSYDDEDSDNKKRELEGKTEGEEFDAGSEYGVITEGGWSWRDKVMGVVGVCFAAGVFLEPVREVVGGSVDVVVSPVTSVLPFYLVVLVLAGVTSVYSSLVRGGMVDENELDAHKERMEDVKARLKEAEADGDEERLEEMRDEQLTVMWSQVNVFKARLRSKAWTVFLSIPVFVWIMWAVGGRGGVAQYKLDGIVVPVAGHVSWTTGLVGPFSVWVVWYVLCSVVFTKIVQKNLNAV